MSWDVIEGDCLEVLRGLPSGSVDCIFTDPPYGHRNNQDDLIARREVALGHPKIKAIARPILNDGPEANVLFRSFLAEVPRLLRSGACCCCCCCCGGGGPDPQFARWSLWMDENLDFKQMVVWDKGPMGMGWHYRRSYETVLVAQKRGAACRWFDTTHRIENVVRHIRKIIPRADQHPTEKPVALADHFLGLHAALGDTVLDPFMGTGSTGVAAVRRGLNFIGVEIVPEYAAIARARIAAAVAEMEAA